MVKPFLNDAKMKQSVPQLVTQPIPNVLLEHTDNLPCHSDYCSELTMHSCNVASTSPKLATACHAMRTYW